MERREERSRERGAEREERRERRGGIQTHVPLALLLSLLSSLLSLFSFLLLLSSLSSLLSPLSPLLSQDKLTFAIAVEADADMSVTHNTRFVTHDEGECGRLWGSFNTRGEVREAEGGGMEEAAPGQAIGAALCVKVRGACVYVYCGRVCVCVCECVSLSLSLCV